MTRVQKATSDNENVDAAKRHALDITRCGKYSRRGHTKVQSARESNKLSREVKNLVHWYRLQSQDLIQRRFIPQTPLHRNFAVK